MPEDGKPAAESPLKTIKDAAEVLKATKDLIPGMEKQGHVGPLQVVGRLLLGLAAILAFCVSASGFFDWKIGHGLSESTYWLRGGMLVLLGSCLLGSVILIGHLALNYPSLLSSPSAWAESVQPDLLPAISGPREAPPPMPTKEAMEKAVTAVAEKVVLKIAEKAVAEAMARGPTNPGTGEGT